MIQFQCLWARQRHSKPSRSNIRLSCASCCRGQSSICKIADTVVSDEILADCILRFLVKWFGTGVTDCAAVVSSRSNASILLLAASPGLRSIGQASSQGCDEAVGGHQGLFLWHIRNSDGGSDTGHTIQPWIFLLVEYHHGWVHE
eukprot:scaffold28040_cov54-Attheya_sp.AAC.5